MNRKLKFRVWDRLVKQFIYPDKGYQGHYVLDLNGRFQNLQNGSGGNEYVVQQYTGFEDINRKEIFEGDIIEFEVPTKDNSTKKLTATIDYGLGAFLVMAKSEDGDLLFPLLHDLHDKIYKYQIKIIGNSFENPELLN